MDIFNPLAELNQPIEIQFLTSGHVQHTNITVVKRLFSSQGDLLWLIDLSGTHWNPNAMAWVKQITPIEEETKENTDV